MFLISLLLIIFLCLSVSESAKLRDLPSYFPRCYRNDPKLNECLLNATSIVKPFLVKGVPELGIPSIDPFLIPEIVLEQGTRAVNFKATLHNINAYGLGNYKFSQFDFDLPNLDFICKARIDPLYLSGNYSVLGKILLAPIQGNGMFRCNVTDIDVTVYQKIHLVKRRGLEYAQPTNTTTSIKIRDAKAVLDGLFDGNEALAKATNDVINDNIHELVEEVKPAIENVITRIVEDLIFKGLENNIPFNKLYAIK